MKLLRLVFLLFCLSGIFLAPSIASYAVERKVPSSSLVVQFSYAPLVKQAAPAVVNIYTKRVVKMRRYSPFAKDPFFQGFSSDQFRGSPRERIERSLGSGVIVKGDGVIVTNYHVVDGADEIIVALLDKREFAATVILSDEKTDLAVLRIKTGGEILPTLNFADSSAVEVGDLVLAIGNPFGVGQSVTSGIVSALARTQINGKGHQFFIQTDAAVNPGNSGGALVGMGGNLIGINTAIFSKSGGSVGIGFAIPANMVKYIVSSALSGRKIDRAWFGATGLTVTAEIAESIGLNRPGGILVSTIYPDSPADRAGLARGDVILRIDGKDVPGPEALHYYIGLKPIRTMTSLEILRKGKPKTLQVLLMTAPENPPRNITTIGVNNLFRGTTLANLSPAYADEIGVSIYEKGVIIVTAPQLVTRQTGLRGGDIFQTINGHPVKLIRDVEMALKQNPWNINYTLKRDGKKIGCVIRKKGRSYCK